MAEATIRGKAGFYNNGTATIVASVPTDATAPVVGDWMIVTIIDTGSSTITVPAPTGWTTLLARAVIGTRGLTIFGKRRAANETSYTFTFSGSSAMNGSIVYGPGGVVDPASWQIGAFTKNSAAVAGLTLPSMTTTAPSLVLALFGMGITNASETDAQNTIAAPFTKVAWIAVSSSPPPPNKTFIASLSQTEKGATGTAAYTRPTAAANLGGVMVAIPTLVDVVAHLNGRVFDGATIVNGTYQLYDGTKLVELASVRLVRMGRKVSELHRNGHIPVIAHRGGSRDFAEHSLRGYTECALLGVDALEFSVAITSDKKWIGLHDSTINRTSPAAPANWNPQDHTWAELQAFKVSVGDLAGFGPQPYMLLDDLVAAYGATHTLVLDPKVIGGANLPAFYAKVKTIPDYQERVVLKYFHTGTGVADAARAMGVKSWGYSYSDDVNGVNSPSTAATAGRWDYLGLEYSATADTWKLMLGIANGKPVWGHICPTAAAAATAVSNGASGLMVSGVVDVMAARYYAEANDANLATGFGTAAFGSTPFGE